MPALKLRRGTAALWASRDPILETGEPGYETDTGLLKIGTGALWSATPYQLDGTATELSVQELRLSDLSMAAQVLFTFGLGPSKRAPERVTPLRPSGSTWYIDPTYAGANGASNGTFSRPYTSFAASFTAHPPAAGEAHLIKRGTTEVRSALFQFAPTGTLSQANPFVIGVYDDVTGERLSNVGTGLATINVNSTATVGVYWTNANYVCIDGLRFINATGTGLAGLIDIEGTSANCQVLNCDASNGTANGIYIASSGLGNVIEGCKINGNAGSGVANFIGATANDLRVTHNSLSGNLGHGVLAYHAGGTYTYVGTVACNTIYGGTGIVSCYGVFVFAGGGAAQVYMNDVRRYIIGVNYISGAAAAADCTGGLVENNTLKNNEFGVQIINVRGGRIQYNYITGSGSFDGTAPITADKYGRAIEVFASTDVTAPSDWTIAYNYCAESYCFLEDGSEGVGIGLDNRSKNIRVFSNICVNNEGHGIQANSNIGYCTIAGNLIVGNTIAPPSRGVTWSPGARAEIAVVLSPRTRIYNNTVVSTAALYGIVDSPAYPCLHLEVRNNLLIGASAAGILRNATHTTESNNVIEGAPVAVINEAYATVSNGPGTSRVNAGTTGAAAPYYLPPSGGICDGTGYAISPGLQSLRGAQLAQRTPIGALHPA